MKETVLEGLCLNLFDNLADTSLHLLLLPKELDGQPISGQSYKHFTLVNYESRVVPDWNIPHITTLES